MFAAGSWENSTTGFMALERLPPRLEPLRETCSSYSREPTAQCSVLSRLPFQMYTNCVGVGLVSWTSSGVSEYHPFED